MIEEWKFYKETFCTRCNHKVYEISNFGRIRINGEIVKPKLSKDSKYYGVANAYLHRVVAKLFVPNPDNKPCVDHIDGDRSNNRADNLRWVTYKENSNNPITLQRHDDALRDEEIRRKISKAKKDSEWPEESKQKLKDKIAKNGGHKGNKNPMYGKGYLVSGERNGMYGKPSPTRGRHWKLVNGKRMYY